MAPAWPSPRGAPPPACLGSCCHQPSHCPATLSPDPLGVSPPSVFLRGGGAWGERQPWRLSQPFPGDDATPGCAPSGSGLCSEGGPASPHPGGGRSTGVLLEFSHHSPSCAGGTVLHCPVLQLVGGGGAHDLPDPRASPQRLEFVCPCLGRTPVSLAASIPTVRGRQGAWSGGWALTAGSTALPAIPPSSPTPSARAQGPQKGSCGLWSTGLAWPRGPLPAPSWVGPGLVCPGPEGSSMDRPGSTARGAGWGQPSPPLAGQCAPPGLSSPIAPCPVSATAHGAPPRPPHAPLCQSRCRVWCRAFSPWGWVGVPSPPIYSLPGAFLCRFLNVILKSGK